MPVGGIKELGGSTTTPSEENTMTVARDIMTPDATYCSADTTAADAARKMADENVGAIPVCGTDGRLRGVVTDRDLA